MQVILTDAIVQTGSVTEKTTLSTEEAALNHVMQGGRKGGGDGMLGVESGRYGALLQPMP